MEELNKYFMSKVHSGEWTIDTVNSLKALIIRVTDSIIGEKEVVTSFFRRYGQAPGDGDIEAWLEKCIEPISRNKLRSEQRIKRDELLSK